MEIYSLSRYFWDFAFEHPTKIKPVHISIYFFAVEHCNRLGWKRNFGLPTSMVLEAIGVKSYSVYKAAFDQLVEYGFFDVIQYSKNQYSSNVIALKENYKAHTKAHTKAPTKALDKAMRKHLQKQSKSTVSINKQDTIDQYTLDNINTIKSFDFKKAFLDLDVDVKTLEDWLKVRKAKKAVNSETAFNGIKKKMEASGKSFNECVTISAEKSWAGFDIEWLKEKQTKYDNRANITKLKEIVYEDF